MLGLLYKLRAASYVLLIASLLLSPQALAQNISQPSPNPSGGIAAGGAPVQALSPAQEARAQVIGRTIRCPVCQGLPITESPSDLSQQMLRELREQVQAGQSSDQITTYFAARYGDTVLLDPPRRGVNLLLWLGPLAAALAGGGWLLSTIRARGKLAAEGQSDEPDDVPDDYLAQVKAQVKAEVAHGRTP
jgi:cytochrome c-type biogenesis protein CcmH